VDFDCVVCVGYRLPYLLS